MNALKDLHTNQIQKVTHVCVVTIVITPAKHALLPMTQARATLAMRMQLSDLKIDPLGVIVPLVSILPGLQITASYFLLVTLNLALQPAQRAKKQILHTV